MSANLCISNSNITHESKFYNLENLSDTRKRLKLTQTDVAQKLYALDKAENPDAEPLKRQTIGQWESGTVYIPVIRLMQLSKIYGVSMDYLMGLDKDYTNTQNAEIGRLTGLSDKAINELRYLKSATAEPVDENAASKLAVLNFILETPNDILLSLWDFLFSQYLPEDKTLTAKRENGKPFEMSNSTLQKTALLDIVNTVYYLKGKAQSADIKPQKKQNAKGFHLDLTSFKLLDNSLSGHEKRLI